MRQIIEPQGYTTAEHRLFESLEDMLNAVQANSGNHQAISRWNGNSTDGEWVGRQFTTVQSMVSAARTTWEKGLEIIERMGRQLDDACLPKPVSRKRRMQHRYDDGDELDFDRLRGGQEFWRSSKRRTVHGSAAITILVDVGANCHVDHDDILWRGAAAVCLTKILEKAGYRVELHAYQYAKDLYTDDGDGSNTVCLKRTQDPIDISTLVNCVSGWFFRTAFFQAMCMSKSGNRPVTSHLGRHRAAKSEYLDLITKDSKRIVVDGIWSFDAASQFIRSKLAELFTTNTEAVAAARA